MKLLDLMIGLFYLSRRNIFKINEFILSELTIKCVIGWFFFFFFGGRFVRILEDQWKC